jgi:hypothetical protein
MENVYGTSRFLLIYVLSGFAGSLASHVFSDAPLSVGASGAIFGLVGAGIAFLIFYGSRLPPQARRTYLIIFLFIAGADTFLSVSELIIDQTAHLGGLVLGFLTGGLLRPVLGDRPGVPPWKRIGASAAAVLAVLLLGLCSVRGMAGEFGGMTFPADIDYTEFTHESGGFRIPVPRRFVMVENETDFVRFLGPPGIGVTVEVLPRLHYMDLGERALSIEEDRADSDGSGHPVPTGGPWENAGAGRPSWVITREAGRELVCRAFFLVKGDSIGRIAFTAPPRGLEVFQGIMSKIVSEFRFAGEDHDERASSSR